MNFDPEFHQEETASSEGIIDIETNHDSLETGSIISTNKGFDVVSEVESFDIANEEVDTDLLFDDDQNPLLALDEESIENSLNAENENALLDELTGIDRNDENLNVDNDVEKESDVDILGNDWVEKEISNQSQKDDITRDMNVKENEQLIEKTEATNITAITGESCANKSNLDLIFTKEMGNEPNIEKIPLVRDICFDSNLEGSYSKESNIEADISQDSADNVHKRSKDAEKCEENVEEAEKCKDVDDVDLIDIEACEEGSRVNDKNVENTCVYTTENQKEAIKRDVVNINKNNIGTADVDGIGNNKNLEVNVTYSIDTTKNEVKESDKIDTNLKDKVHNRVLNIRINDEGTKISVSKKLEKGAKDILINIEDSSLSSASMNLESLDDLLKEAFKVLGDDVVSCEEIENADNANENGSNLTFDINGSNVVSNKVIYGKNDIIGMIRDKILQKQSVAKGANRSVTPSPGPSIEFRTHIQYNKDDNETKEAETSEDFVSEGLIDIKIENELDDKESENLSLTNEESLKKKEENVHLQVSNVIHHSNDSLETCNKSAYTIDDGDKNSSAKHAEDKRRMGENEKERASLCKLNVTNLNPKTNWRKTQRVSKKVLALIASNTENSVNPNKESLAGREIRRSLRDKILTRHFEIPILPSKTRRKNVSERIKSAIVDLCDIDEILNGRKSLIIQQFLAKQENVVMIKQSSCLYKTFNSYLPPSTSDTDSFMGDTNKDLVCFEGSILKKALALSKNDKFEKRFEPGSSSCPKCHIRNIGIDHIDEHNVESSIFCSHCNILFRTPQMRNLHMMIHLKPVEKPLKITCSFCESTVFTRKCLRTFIEHVKREHAEVENNADLKCFACNAEFNESTLASLHMQIHIPLHADCSCKSWECYACNALPSLVIPMLDRKFFTAMKPCKICHFRYANLAEHEKVHKVINSRKMYKCGGCNVIFSEYHLAKLHLKYHHMKGIKPLQYSFNCSLCSQTVNTQEMFQHVCLAHVNTAPKFSCKLCSLPVPELSLLAIHRWHHWPIENKKTLGSTSSCLKGSLSTELTETRSDKKLPLYFSKMTKPQLENEGKFSGKYNVFDAIKNKPVNFYDKSRAMTSSDEPQDDDAETQSKGGDSSNITVAKKSSSVHLKRIVQSKPQGNKKSCETKTTGHDIKGVENRMESKVVGRGSRVMDIVSVPKREVCDICAMLFADVKKHRDYEHSKPSRFDCQVCTATFVTKGAADLHAAVHLQKKFIIVLQCSICRLDVKDLEKHVQHYHNNDETSMKCPLCDVYFHEENLLKFHTTQHLPKIGVNSSKESNDPNVDKILNLVEQICHQCKLSVYDIDSHAAEHAPSNAKFRCKVCKLTFQNEIVSSTHALIHCNYLSNISLPCTKCPQFKCFKTARDLLMHFAEVHPQMFERNQPKVNIDCGICGAILPNKFIFDLHKTLHYAKNCDCKVRECKFCNAYSCQKCDRFFSVTSHFNHMRHVNSCKGSKEKASSSVVKIARVKPLQRSVSKEIQQVDLETSDDESDDTTECLTCGQKIPSGTLGQHMRRFHSTKFFSCLKKGCSFSAPSAEMLLYHKATHLERNLFRCLFCTKHFPDQEKVYRHNYVVHFENIHRCNLCGTKFLELSDLKAHNRIYSWDPPKELLCNYCCGSFKNQNLYMKHVKEKHSSEKQCNCSETDCGICSKFKCACGATFKSHQFIYYMMHMRECYQCYVCSFYSFNSSLLAKHELSHYLKCTVCDALMRDNKALTAHLKRHKCHCSNDNVNCLFCKKAWCSACSTRYFKSELDEFDQHSKYCEGAKLMCVCCEKTCVICMKGSCCECNRKFPMKRSSFFSHHVKSCMNANADPFAPSSKKLKTEPTDDTKQPKSVSQRAVDLDSESSMQSDEDDIVEMKRSSQRKSTRTSSVSTRFSSEISVSVFNAQRVEYSQFGNREEDSDEDKDENIHSQYTPSDENTNVQQPTTQQSMEVEHNTIEPTSTAFNESIFSNNVIDIVPDFNPVPVAFIDILGQQNVTDSMRIPRIINICPDDDAMDTYPFNPYESETFPQNAQSQEEQTND